MKLADVKTAAKVAEFGTALAELREHKALYIGRGFQHGHQVRIPSELRDRIIDTILGMAEDELDRLGVTP